MKKKKIVDEELNKYKVNIENIDYKKLKEFKDKCKELTDTRIKKKSVYKLWDVVVVVFLAVLSNCNDWEEIYVFAKSKYKWLRNFLKMTGGIPTTKSYERIISIIKPEELQNMSLIFLKDIVSVFGEVKQDILNIDGKVDKGSSRKENELREKIKSLNVLNVYSNEYKMCIAQEMIENKTNEITTIPIILKRLDIKGKIITWDALNTQKENVKIVIKGKGDYVIALKGNQGNLFNDVKLYFNEDKIKNMRSGNEGSYKIEHEKSNSSEITREYFQIEDVEWYGEYKQWSGLKSIGVIIKTIRKGSSKTIEKRYYISSLKEDIELFSKSIRKHWSVENNLHWHLDFTFKQDDNTTANKEALLNLQILKKLALAVLNRVKDIYKTSLRLIRFRLSLDFENEILTFFNILSK